jgi:hypothetical protein
MLRRPAQLAAFFIFNALASVARMSGATSGVFQSRISLRSCGLLALCHRNSHPHRDNPHFVCELSFLAASTSGHPPASSGR